MAHQDWTMKERKLDGFGERLAMLRKGRGMTQAQLGEAVGVSSRVILYYERESGQPPGALLLDLARALQVTTDELLGAKPIREQVSPRRARFLRRLGRAEQLPVADRRAILKFIDALLIRQQTAGSDRS